MASIVIVEEPIQVIKHPHDYLIEALLQYLEIIYITITTIIDVPLWPNSDDDHR